MTTTEEEPPTHRSVSQIKEYETCPYRYYLHRIKRVEERPAAWLVQGTAVHETIEAIENGAPATLASEIDEIYGEAFARAADKILAKTPNLDWWWSSGRYKAEDDLPRRFELGRKQVDKYIEWMSNSSDEIVVNDGEKMVEFPIDVEYDGVPLKGFIDQGIIRDGQLIVRDVKTGQNPGDVFQLAFYVLAYKAQTGIKAAGGDYFMAAKGEPTAVVAIGHEELLDVAERITAADADIRTGEFPPKPSQSNCARCPVRHACEYAHV